MGLSLTLVFVIFSPALAEALTDMGNGIRQGVEDFIEWIQGVLPS